MPKIPTIGLRAASQSLAATLTTIVGSAAGDNADSTTGAIALGSLSLARLVCQYTRHASSTTGAPVFAVDVSMDAPDTAAARCSLTQVLAVPGTPSRSRARSVARVATAISIRRRRP